MLADKSARNTERSGSVQKSSDPTRNVLRLQPRSLRRANLSSGEREPPEKTRLDLRHDQALCRENLPSYSATSLLDRSVNHLTLRFSNVYGSTRDLPSRVIPTFMMQALRGEDITLYGGEQVLDFTFIDDTISGIVKAYTSCLDGHRELFGEDFHFVTGRGVSVASLAKMIVNLVGSHSKIITSDGKGFEVRKFIGDPRNSYELLGYEPRDRLLDELRILSSRRASSIQVR